MKTEVVRMAPAVRYDFEAATRLSGQLTQLAAKIEWLAWLRSGQHSRCLGGSHSDNWQGAKRHHFDAEYRRQQAALDQLAAAARKIKTQVDQATAEAHAAQKKH